MRVYKKERLQYKCRTLNKNGELSLKVNFWKTPENFLSDTNPSAGLFGQTASEFRGLDGHRTGPSHAAQNQQQRARRAYGHFG